MNIGARNSIVTALASGIDCISLKYKISPIMPVALRRIRIFLLFPQKLILFIFNKMILMINETIALKKTISIAGM